MAALLLILFGPSLRRRGDGTSRCGGQGCLWKVSAPLLEDPPEVLLYAPGSWGPGPIRDLIAPNRWRLPFERRWREAKFTEG
jgi:glucose-6-phosphate 1-dehydrogenase